MKRIWSCDVAKKLLGAYIQLREVNFPFLLSSMGWI